MDPFTHTFVGLAAAKAGLDRLSPMATTVCILAANSPDSDIVVRFTSGSCDYLHHHRGITHSIVGVLALAVMAPALIWLGERGFARLRRTQPRTRLRGLLLASLIVTATHPLMDWTNNYGVRPFLPWNSQWHYGDLVFIIDPYIMLLVGGAAFLANSKRPVQIVLWLLFVAGIVALSVAVMIGWFPQIPGRGIAIAVLLTGVVVLALVRRFGIARGRERVIAMVALAAIVFYWGGLSVLQRRALGNATGLAQAMTGTNEQVLRVAAMPTLANPFRWACVAETGTALYRFPLPLNVSSGRLPPIVDGYQTDTPDAIERFEKPTGRAAELVSVAAQDRCAKILLNFARFPIARVQDENCFSQTIVQIADLRYTEPGATRGSFSLNVPVECASK